MILVSDIIDELSVNPDFNLLSDSQQIEIMNFVQQEVCGEYNQAGKNFYLGSPFPDSVNKFTATLALTIPAQTISMLGTQIRTSYGTLALTVPAQTINLSGTFTSP
jgi:hypothetical protein